MPLLVRSNVSSISTGNPVKDAINAAVLELMLLKPPRIVGPHADAADIEARGEVLEEMALIFDRLVMALATDTAEHCPQFDPSDFENAIAERVAPLISVFDEAAHQWEEENGQFGVGA